MREYLASCARIACVHKWRVEIVICGVLSLTLGGIAVYRVIFWYAKRQSIQFSFALVNKCAQHTDTGAAAAHRSPSHRRARKGQTDGRQKRARQRRIIRLARNSIVVCFCMTLTTEQSRRKFVHPEIEKCFQLLTSPISTLSLYVLLCAVAMAIQTLLCCIPRTPCRITSRLAILYLSHSLARSALWPLIHTT